MGGHVQWYTLYRAYTYTCTVLHIHPVQCMHIHRVQCYTYTLYRAYTYTVYHCLHRTDLSLWPRPKCLLIGKYIWTCVLCRFEDLTVSDLQQLHTCKSLVKTLYDFSTLYYLIMLRRGFYCTRGVVKWLVQHNVKINSCIIPVDHDQVPYIINHIQHAKYDWN